MDVGSKGADVLELGPRGLVGHVEERLGLGDGAGQERHPRVGELPRAVALVPAAARPVKRAGHDPVPHPFAGTLISRPAREVGAVEPALARAHRRLVVRITELDPIPVREAVIGGVQVAAVVQLGLRGLVVDHRVQAVRVGQREVEDLKLDGNAQGLPVRGHGGGAFVETAGQVARGVDLDPDRLVALGVDAEGQAAPSRARILGDELDRLPTRRVARRGRTARLPSPIRVGRLRHVQVVDGEDLEGTPDGLRRIGAGGGVGDPSLAAALAQLGQGRGQGLDSPRVGLHHHLERDDLVPRAEEAHGLAVPGGVARAQRAREVVLLDLLAVADRPHARDAGLGEGG
jgi:hypothetical protein